MDFKTIISILKKEITKDITYNTFIETKMHLFTVDNNIYNNKNIIKELFYIIKNNPNTTEEELYTLYLMSRLEFFSITVEEKKYNASDEIYDILFKILSNQEELEITNNSEIYILRNNKIIGINNNTTESSKSDLTMFGVLGLLEDKSRCYIKGFIKYENLKIMVRGNLKINSIRLESGEEFNMKNIDNEALIQTLLKSKYHDDVKLYSVAYLNNPEFIKLFTYFRNTSKVFNPIIVDYKQIPININYNAIEDNVVSNNSCIHINELRKIKDNNIADFIKKYTHEEEYIYCKLCGERLFIYNSFSASSKKINNIQLKTFFENSKYEKYIYSFYTIKNYIISFSHVYKNNIHVSDFSILINFLDILFYITNNINELSKQYFSKYQNLYFIRLSADLFTNTQRVKEQYEDYININMIIIFFILYIEHFPISILLDIKRAKFINDKVNFIYLLLNKYLSKINPKYSVPVKELQGIVSVYRIIINNAIQHDIDINKIQDIVNSKNNTIQYPHTSAYYDTYSAESNIIIPKYQLKPKSIHYQIFDYTRFDKVNDIEFNNILDMDIDMEDFNSKKNSIIKDALYNNVKYENSLISFSSLYSEQHDPKYIVFARNDGKELVRPIDIFAKNMTYFSNIYHNILNLGNKFFFIDKIITKNQVNNIYTKFIYNTFGVIYIFNYDTLTELKNKFLLILYKLLKYSDKDIIQWIQDNKDYINNYK